MSMREARASWFGEGTTFLTVGESGRMRSAYRFARHNPTTWLAPPGQLPIIDRRRNLNLPFLDQVRRGKRKVSWVERAAQRVRGANIAPIVAMSIVGGKRFAHIAWIAEQAY